MRRKRHSFIIEALIDGKPRTAKEIRDLLIREFDGVKSHQLDFPILIGLSCCKARGLIVEHPARYQLASAAMSPQPATTAADLLAIERSLNEGLRKELDHTHAALMAALSMLTPEQAANLITKLQQE